METRNYLHYTTEKTIGKKRIVVRISLDDECKNGICNFAITADEYEEADNGRWVDAGGGCIHDEILRFFPEFKDFVNLHLSNVHGQPMHPVENGLYWLKQGLCKGAEYLRTPAETAEELVTTEKEFFKYQLFSLGIVKAWQDEADKAIAHLESLAGYKFANPYEPSAEKFALTMTDEERADIEDKIARLYYSTEAIKAREMLRKEKDTREKREAIASRYDKDISRAVTEKRIHLYIFDSLGTDDNIIYYDHSNTLSFNWREPQYASFCKHWTQAEFDAFKANADMSIFPTGCEFKLERTYKA